MMDEPAGHAGDETQQRCGRFWFGLLRRCPSYGRRKNRFQGINFRVSETNFASVRLCERTAGATGQRYCPSRKELNETIV
jgi:hypothetical protein